MSSRRNRRKVSNYGNYISSTNNDLPLVISNSFRILLQRILDMGHEPISKRLLEDSDSNNKISKISWLNLTNNIELISFTIKDKIRGDKDPWNKKNRLTSDIKRIIKKIYKRDFSNGQIKIFNSKYRKIFNELKHDKSYIENNTNKKFTINELDILNKVIDITENNILKWENVYSSPTYNKYSSKYPLTDNKNILIEIYHLINSKSFIIINLSDDRKERPIHITNLFDEDAINILLYLIDKNN